MHVTRENTITNHTDLFILVGNCYDIVSRHDTLEEAENALSKINVADTQWSSIWVLTPGESRQGAYTQTIYPKQDTSIFDKIPEVVGVEKASEILGLAPGTIKNMCADGKIPATKVGKTWVIDKSSLKSSE